jgi:hypothetical protein
MAWGTFADEGRRTVENYPKYDAIEDYVEYYHDGLINSPETYQIPHWYKQRIIVEVWLEKESLTGTFNALLADRNKEINVRKCKGFDGWEAAAWNFLQIARIMEAEDQNKFVVILYWGDQDPSGEMAFKHLMEQVKYFRNMTMTNAVEYSYVCRECEHTEAALKDEINDDVTCPNCRGDMDVMWFAPSYEDYLKDQGLEKYDTGNVSDLK